LGRRSSPRRRCVEFAREWTSWKPFISLGGFWIGESGGGSDTYLYGLQAGSTLKLTDTISLTGGASVFKYDHIEGRGPVYDGEFFGNTSRLSVYHDPTSALIYEEDFTEVEAFLEAGSKIGGVPVKVFGDYVQNVDASDNDTGWLVGFGVGKCKDKGSWELKYNYRDVEADAVFGTFADSDLIGGGTDGRGHEIGAGYQLSKRAKLGLTYFVNERNRSTQAEDFERLQVDLNFKF